MPLLPIIADDGEAVARHRVELHAGEAEGAVAEQQADLAVGVGELGADRLAGAGAEAAEGAGVHPAAGLVGVDEAAGVGDEVAAVADHDRVAVEHLAELPVDAHRVQRGAVVVELRLLGRRASRPRPRAARRPRRVGARRGAGATAASRSAASVAAIVADQVDLGLAVGGQLVRRRVEPDRSSSPRRSCRRSRGGSRAARRRRARRRRPSGPAPRARLKQSSWSAGRQPRPRPLRKTGMPSASASARSSLLAVPPVEAGAGHDRRPLGRRRAAPRPPRPRRPAAASSAGVGSGTSASRLDEDDVERIVDEGRAGRAAASAVSSAARGRAPRSAPVSLTVSADLTSGETKGRWSISWSEPEPQRISGARPPSTHERRAVGLRAGDRAHPVGHPGPGGQRRDARLAGRLREALGREGGGLLVADVDDLDPLLLAAVVDREQVAAGEREQLRDAAVGERPGDQLAAVDGAALAARRPRRGRSPRSSPSTANPKG